MKKEQYQSIGGGCKARQRFTICPTQGVMGQWSKIFDHDGKFKSSMSKMKNKANSMGQGGHGHGQ